MVNTIRTGAVWLPAPIDADAEAEKRRQARVKALKEEFDQLAGDGGIEALTAALAKVEAEEGALLASMLTLKALAESGQGLEHRERYAAAHARMRDVVDLKGNLTGSLRTARQERAASMAMAFMKSSEYRASANAEAVKGAAELEATATAVTLWEAERMAGADAGSMAPPAAPYRVEALRQFERWIADLARFGVKLDLARLPPAVRERLEASR